MEKLTRNDFVSNQEVRWCPGCGDYAVLAGVQKLMPELGIARENIVFISGIGCSGRFPYYMNTYGFHTIHGRGPAVATGLKLARPELSVWLITGDGDGLSIGANHLLHILRRNVDVKILLFNNRIYGLTKGQYSPTSEQGKVTNTTPQGALDRPLNPMAIALAANATFAARVLDVDAKGLNSVLMAAAHHRGSAFIEIYQNCHIFNDATFAHVSDKQNRSDNMLWLEEGKPFIFGKDADKTLLADNYGLRVGSVAEAGDALLCHDVKNTNLSFLLSQMNYPEFPVPMGIFRSISAPTYEDLAVQNQVAMTAKKGVGKLQDLLHSGRTWKVEA